MRLVRLASSTKYTYVICALVCILQCIGHSLLQNKLVNTAISSKKDSLTKSDYEIHVFKCEMRLLLKL